MSAIDYSVSTSSSSQAPYGDIPELQSSYAPSSSTNSNVPSPDNIPVFESQKPKGVESINGLPTPSYSKASTLRTKHHPYSRIDVKDLLQKDPNNLENQAQVLDHDKLKEKRRTGNLNSLEYSIRKGLQIAQQQKYCRAPTSNSSNSNQLVGCLIDLSAMLIDQIWGTNAQNANKEDHKSLHHYVTEIFRRSRVTKTVVQVALIYCLRVKQTVITTRQYLASQVGHNQIAPNAALCGRRMFLAALICASKYLQDSNFSNKTWAKIVGLTPSDTSLSESSFLKMLGYKLYVKDLDFFPYAKAILDQATLKGSVNSSAYLLIKELFPRGQKKMLV